MIAVEAVALVSLPAGRRPERIGDVGSCRRTEELLSAGRLWGQHECNSIPRNPNEGQPTPAGRSVCGMVEWEVGDVRA